MISLCMGTTLCMCLPPVSYTHIMNSFSDSTIDFDFFLQMAMPPLNIPCRNLNAAPLLEGKEKNDYVQLLPKLAFKYDFSPANNMYRLLGEMSEVDPDHIIIYGNSSLNVMFDSIARSMTQGVMGVIWEIPRLLYLHMLQKFRDS